MKPRRVRITLIEHRDGRLAVVARRRDAHGYEESVAGPADEECRQAIEKLWRFIMRGRP